MLRLCESKDYKDIWEINKEDLGYELDLDVCHKQLDKILNDKAAVVYVYECDGKVVGYIHARRYDDIYANPMVSVVELTVAKDYRRNGIGGLLLLMVEDWASGIGVQGVRLDSGLSRDVATQFYQAWGYDGLKTNRNYMKFF